MQRIVGIPLGYEDLIDHEELRHDPVLVVLAGKSTLNRLERRRPEPSRYARLAADLGMIEALFVDRRFAIGRAGLYSLTQAAPEPGSTAQQAEASRALDVFAAAIRSYSVPDDLSIQAIGSNETMKTCQ